MAKAKVRFVIELEAPDEPDEFGRDPLVRLRRFLKGALRAWGFKCVTVNGRDETKAIENSDKESRT